MFEKAPPINTTAAARDLRFFPIRTKKVLTNICQQTVRSKTSDDTSLFR